VLSSTHALTRIVTLGQGQCSFNLVLCEIKVLRLTGSIVHPSTHARTHIVTLGQGQCRLDLVHLQG
jgi:hypothetical protein